MFIPSSREHWKPPRRRAEYNNHSERTLSDGATASVGSSAVQEKHSLKLLQWIKCVSRCWFHVVCLQLFFSDHVPDVRDHFIDGSILRTYPDILTDILTYY